MKCDASSRPVMRGIDNENTFPEFGRLLSMRIRLSVFLIFFGLGFLHAQTDTLFWFAAPDVSYGYANFDKPILLRISSTGLAADLMISQPANPGFVPISISLNAGASRTVDLSTWLDQIENKPADRILNNGLLIRSTRPVTVYYEVLSSQCACNPEIFALKGSNALGNDFIIPMQTFLENNPGYVPQPFSSFDLVATEDSTLVSITPAFAIIGHSAGLPFNIYLNKGQTYSGTAADYRAGTHLQGSRVKSDKPIAITIKDDLLSGVPYGGGCADLGGDQIVPLRVWGSEYIMVRGFLNPPYDRAFFLATRDNTLIWVNNQLRDTLMAGETYVCAIGNNKSAYIRTSAPVAALQMSGFGCEVGLSILPPIRCTGSQSVAFTRSLNEPIFITLLVKSGGQGNFLLNGSSAIVTASLFDTVPGTMGEWMSAQISLSNLDAPVAVASIIENSTHLFHMGLIHGTAGGGCRFGYFSNFNKIDANFGLADSACAGNEVLLSYEGPLGSGAMVEWDFFPAELTQRVDARNVYVRWDTPGTYGVRLNISDAECPDFKVKEIVVLPRRDTIFKISACDSYYWPQTRLSYDSSGVYYDTLTGFLGCDSVVALNLTIQRPDRNVHQVLSCGSYYWPTSGSEYNLSGTYTITLTNSKGCDSVLVLDLEILKASEEKQYASSCDQYLWPVNGSLLTEGGIYRDTLVNHQGCDSIITLDLEISKSIIVGTSVNSCREYVWPINGVRYLNSGQYRDTLQTRDGCDSVLILDLTILAENKFSDTVGICESYIWPVTGDTLIRSGHYISTFQNSAGCDSVHSLELTILESSSWTDTIIACGKYTWSVTGLSYTQSGTYRINEINQVGCDSQLILHLDIYPEYAFSDTQRHCSSFFWNVNGQAYRQSGDYLAALQSVQGCDSILSLHLRIDPEYLIADTISALDRYYWPLTRVVYDQAGIYSHQILTQDGCDSIHLLVLEIRKRGNVYVPNAFTPNGDGVNDRFTVYASPEVKSIKRLRIYDRWGELVFEQSDFPPNDPVYGWDGHFNGHPAGPAVFACTVEWLDGEGDSHILAGDATLVR